MSARQLLWWGVGLLVGSTILSMALLRSQGRVGLALPGDVMTLVATLSSVAHQIGIGLIVVSFAVAALSRLPAEQRPIGDR